MTRSDSPDGDVTFEGTLEVERLATAVDAASTLVDECRFRVREDGVEVRAIDAATVGVVQVDLGAAAFESFRAVDFAFGVDLERLAAALGVADASGLAHLAFDAERRRLDLRVGGVEYAMAAIDSDAVRRGPAREEFEFEESARAVLDGADVRRAVRAADTVSDHLALGVDPETEVVYAEASGDTDDVRVAYPFSDLHEFDPREARALFSTDYLDSVARVLPADDPVAASVRTEQPVELAYEFADGAGSVSFVVAPRLAAT